MPGEMLNHDNFISPIQMLHFLYFGRLDREKGRHAIIAMIEHFIDKETDTLPFVLHIFGRGSYENTLLHLAERFPHHIIYYGFQPIEHIKDMAKNCDYCLMPSLFLETFGLSAVNALSRGLPVIGYQQGGMTPFVLDAYNLGSIPGSHDQQLITMMHHLIKKGKHRDATACLDIAKKYNKEQWLEQFAHIAQTTTETEGKKILLVTDFSHKIGGIETYIYDVATLLAQGGHDVEIIGGPGGTTKSSRIWSMIFSIYNIFFAWKLQKKIDTFVPDIIWCHSVLRHIGRMGLKTINKSKAKKWMMYHDLGYFHPFPHTLTHETDLPPSFSWKDFSHNIHRPLIKFFALGKWILLKLLWKELKRFDIHLVPSNFMVDSIAHTIDKSPIVWPHFIQE